MRATCREFTSFTEHRQQKVLNLLVEKYTLRGEDAPVKKALEKIAEQRPQTNKAWSRFNWFTMQAIDKALVEKGLPPKHGSR